MTTFGIGSGAPLVGPRRPATIGGHLTQTRWCKKLEANFCLGAGLGLPPSLFCAIQSTEEELEESSRIVKYVEMNSVLPAGWRSLLRLLLFFTLWVCPQQLHGTGWKRWRPQSNDLIGNSSQNPPKAQKFMGFGITVMFGLFTVKFGPFTFPSRSHHAHPEMKT